MYTVIGAVVHVDVLLLLLTTVGICVCVCQGVCVCVCVCAVTVCVCAEGAGENVRCTKCTHPVFLLFLCVVLSKYCENSIH